jgi:ABC-type Fe3+ transport system substrate-binding protein
MFGSLKEGMGITSSSGNLGLVNRPPHPNAAKVYLNWFLSREGQLTLQNEYAKAKVTASNSLRIDISKDMVPPAERLQDGVDYVEVETPERISMEPVLKVFSEALSRAGK